MYVITESVVPSVEIGRFCAEYHYIEAFLVLSTKRNFQNLKKSQRNIKRH